jgi:hypothetical protein
LAREAQKLRHAVQTGIESGCPVTLAAVFKEQTEKSGGRSLFFQQDVVNDPLATEADIKSADDPLPDVVGGLVCS